MAIVATLASVGLLLIVVVVAANWGGATDTDQRRLSASNTAQRKPQANQTPRSSATTPAVRTPQTRPVSSHVAKKAPDASEQPVPTAADDGVSSDSTPTPGTDTNPAAVDLNAVSAALASAIKTAQRPVTASPAGTSAELPETGSPKDYVVTPPTPATDSEETKELSLAEKRQLAETAKLKKLIRRHFIAQRRSDDRSRGQPEDVFVVVKYEMPLDTRVADVRFEISTAVEPSVEQVADYLLATPAAVVRDFQVVSRFSSMSDADQGIIEVRQRYDQAKEYQAQMLAFLRAQQQVQASSIRRC